MARIFLDTNYFIDAVHRRPETQILVQLQNHIVYISPISVYNFYYTFKIRTPNQLFIKQLEKFNYIDFTGDILHRALQGPTSDIEDNIQLHSSAESDCDYFLTNDIKLLAMKFFGKTKILSSLTS
ncbi:type II toxin-antitoxin system VapC family toxin [Candidatus Gottesmanbacteria bacterium]|nr:type II toxin-antitoxin system VapC family toxin [Candidatus Gottesmanbacteria bacterium]